MEFVFFAVLRYAFRLRQSQFQPHWFKTWVDVRKDKEKPAFAKIDVVYDKVKFKNFGLQATPSVIVCAKGECSNYLGQFDYKSLAKFIRKNLCSSI